MACFLRSLCGFRDAITFKEVDDTIMGQVEDFVKNELADVLTTWETNGIVINREHFYGEFYAYSAKTFKFSIGDRMQIKKMVDYVKMKYDENGVQFSGAHDFHPLKSNKREKPTRFFGEKNPVATNQLTEIDSTDKKHMLVEKISKLYRKCDMDSQFIAKLSIEQIEIEQFADGKIRALFHCPLCDKSNKENLFVIQTKQVGTSSSKIYWVLSNYTKHINAKHAHAKKRKKLPAFDIGSLITSERENETIELDDHHVESIQNLEPSTDIKTNPDDLIDENYDDDDDEERLVDNSIEIIEVSVMQSDNDLSYNDFESLIYTQITAQLNEMHAVSMKNNEIEKNMNFVVGDVICTMKINTTKPDGACLLRSTEHQLFKSNLQSRAHTNGTNKLRKEVVEFIKQHRKMFDKELKGAVYDWYESMGKSTKNIENFSMVCDDFLRKELPKTKCWAGTESLKAITLDKSVNILILVENGICYFSNGFNENYSKTIILAHCTYSNDTQTTTEHTGQILNHYDSVVYIDPNDVFLLSKRLATISANRHQPKLITTANEI